MGAIIVKSDKKGNKILKELAERLGANVINLNDDQFEDFLLGKKMDLKKTGELVSREEIFKKFRSK